MTDPIASGNIPATPPMQAASADLRKPMFKRRSMTLDALFNRQLHQLLARILDAQSVEHIMLEMSHEICTLLNADSLTL